MRSFLTFGAISLVGIAALYACGDDSGDGGIVANGGSAGTGGSAGAGGGAGAGGSVATGGSAGANVGGSAGGAAVDVSPIATCTGCIELIAPLSGANDNGGTTNLADTAIFQVAIPSPGANFTNGVVTWKIMALQNNDGLALNTFAQNGPPDAYVGVYPTYRALSAVNFPPNAWVDVVLNVGAYRGSITSDAGVQDAGTAVDAGDAGALLDPGNAFAKERVQTLGVQLTTAATFTGSAVARIAIDSVTIAGVPGLTGFTFDTTVEGFSANTYQQPPGTPAPVHH